jgi:hypothetical protein
MPLGVSINRGKCFLKMWWNLCIASDFGREVSSNDQPTEFYKNIHSRCLNSDSVGGQRFYAKSVDLLGQTRYFLHLSLKQG